MRSCHFQQHGWILWALSEKSQTPYDLIYMQSKKNKYPSLYIQRTLFKWHGHVTMCSASQSVLFSFWGKWHKAEVAENPFWCWQQHLLQRLFCEAFPHHPRQNKSLLCFDSFVRHLNYQTQEFLFTSKSSTSLNSWQWDLVRISSQSESTFSWWVLFSHPLFFLLLSSLFL